jgi:hypothetical protein
MRFLLWAGGVLGAIWWAQNHGWIAGTRGTAVVLAVALWVAFPFVRAYVKVSMLAQKAKHARELMQAAQAAAKDKPDGRT